MSKNYGQTVVRDQYFVRRTLVERSSVNSKIEETQQNKFRRLSETSDLLEASEKKKIPIDKRD